MELSRKVIIFIAAVLILVIGGGITYAMNTPTARAERQLNLGNKYLQEGKYQEAILAFQKVIKIEPKNIPARLGLGNAYIATEEFDKAETVLKEVIDIDPNNIPAREELFKVYVKEGNLEAAKSILEEIAALNPNIDLKQFNIDLDLAKTLSASKASYDQGIKQMNEKNYLEAMASFQKVIKEDTDRYDDAQAKIGECKTAFIEETLQKAKDAAASKDYKTALNLLEQVLKIDPGNQDALKLKSEYVSALSSNSQALEKIYSVALNEAKKLGTNPKINKVEEFDINGDGVKEYIVSLNYSINLSPFGKLIEILENNGEYKISNITEQYDSNNTNGGNFAIKKFSNNDKPQIISWWSGGSGGYLSILAQINNNNSYETIWNKSFIYKGTVQVKNDRIDFNSNGTYVFSYPDY